MKEPDIDKNTEKTIYDLRLHESLTTVFGIWIMRVPGGWIYDCWDIEKDEFKRGIFVPFSPEFQPLNENLTPPFLEKQE